MSGWFFLGDDRIGTDESDADADADVNSNININIIVSFFRNVKIRIWVVRQKIGYFFFGLFTPEAQQYPFTKMSLHMKIGSSFRPGDVKNV